MDWGLGIREFFGFDRTDTAHLKRLGGGGSVFGFCDSMLVLVDGHTS